MLRYFGYWGYRKGICFLVYLIFFKDCLLRVILKFNFRSEDLYFFKEIF